MKPRVYGVVLSMLALALVVVWAAPALASPLSQTKPEDDWTRVQKAGKIVFGTSGDYPPFEFYSSNYQLDGFDIALAKELSKRLGVQVEFNDFAFDGLLDALRLGQVDAAIAAISVTPDRQQLVDFTQLYYIGEDAVLARSDFKGSVRSATDLADKKVGVQRGTTYQAWAQENLVDKGLITQEELVTFQDANAMIRDLRNRKVDLALLGLLPAEQFDTRFADLKIVGQNFNKQKFAIALAPGSTLADPLNQALLEVMQDGTFANLTKQYLGVPVEEVTPGPEDEVTSSGGTATEKPGPASCVWGMAYVADLNLDDKNMKAPPVMQPGQQFTKKWRVRNSGTCAWEPNFTLRYVSGNRPEAEMGAVPVAVGKRVEPGQTVDLAANLRAPTSFGTFQAFWKMHNAAGKSFGETIWVGIQVPNPNPPPPPPPPPLNLNPNLRADSNWITAGQCTTIRWDIDNVNAVYFIDGGNSQGVGGHDSRQVCPPVTTTYVLRVVDRSNRPNDFPITINVQGNAPASINFWVDNGTIDAGQCTTLHWDVQNVSAVYLDEQGVAGQGSQQVCPPGTTTYTLRVVLQDGSQQTRQITVTVNAPPQPGPTINYFAPSTNQINLGQCVDFNWSTSNASNVSLSRSGVILVNGGPPTGSLTDCPGQPGLYDYELVAFGNGQVNQRVSVEVRPIQPR